MTCIFSIFFVSCMHAIVETDAIPKTKAGQHEIQEPKHKRTFRVILHTKPAKHGMIRISDIEIRLDASL